MPPIRRSRKKSGGIFMVEAIVGKRFTRVRGRQVAEYNVKWLNYPSETNTWEPFSHFKNPQMVHDYNARFEEEEFEAPVVAVRAAPQVARVAAPSSSSSSPYSSSGTASLNLQTPSTSGGPSATLSSRKSNQVVSSSIDNAAGSSTSPNATLDRSIVSFSAQITPTAPSTSELASQAQNETLANSVDAEAPVVNDNDRIDEPSLFAPSTSTGTPSTSSGTSMKSRPVLQAGLILHGPGPSVYEVISNQSGVLVGELTFIGKTVKISEFQKRSLPLSSVTDA